MGEVTEESKAFTYVPRSEKERLLMSLDYSVGGVHPGLLHELTSRTPLPPVRQPFNAGLYLFCAGVSSLVTDIVWAFRRA